MYAPDERLKELYRSDSIEKYMTAEFYRPGVALPFLAINDSTRFLDMTMEESLSSSDNLDFGSCEATQIKLKMLGYPGNIKGCDMLLYQTIDGIYPAPDLYPGSDIYPAGYTMPLGRYVVENAERLAGTGYWEVTALDYMRKFDVEVINWYNALPFPLTLRDFRARLCRHVGVTEHVPEYLQNDGMLVEKTIEASTLIGRDVLIACEQANGVFGHFDRGGVLRHITLQPNYSLLPATDLYPSDDLYPVMPGEMNDQVCDERIDTYLCISGWVEDYTVQSIEKVQIRQEEGDIGAIYGTGENCLTVEGNFLLFGKNAADLHDIARGILGMVSGRMYIPYECNLKGLPYMEVGDSERLELGDQSIVSYIVKRTLKGIYALKDTHSATGEEIRSTESNTNTEIIQLKGKAAILKRNVDEVSANLIDLEKNTEAKFAITAEQISAEVKRAQDAEAYLKIMADNITTSVKDFQKNVESQIQQMANQISLKVSSEDLVSQMQIEINKEGASITFETGHFIVKGQNFYVNADGSGGAANGNFTWDSKGKIELTGAHINGTTNTSNIGCLLLSASTADITSADIDRITCGSASGNDFYARMFHGDLDGEVVFGSDRRLKKNVRDISTETAAQVINELHPVAFEYKKDGRASMGFVAQEVKKICKRHTIDLPLYSMAADGFYRIPYVNYIPLIVLAIQEQQKEIEALKKIRRERQ